MPGRTVILTIAVLTNLRCQVVLGQAVAEQLDRGLVAVRMDEGRVFVGWRLLATDPEHVGFNLYRVSDGSNLLVNDLPITASTNLFDQILDAGSEFRYVICPVVDGVELEPSSTCISLEKPYIQIPLRTPPGYTPNDASVGDLDGDGQYEIVLHQAGVGRDNAQPGLTDPPILEAYRLDGTFLWRINLGINIREGAHYTQFIVYDLDCDGRAEIACKTADGTIDGQGIVIGDANADWRNADGYILDGPEYLTIFDGMTGAAMATTGYIPPRGKVSSWGDSYGNRVDRFLAAVAYLDGARPSLIMCRGYYTRMVIAAWDWQDGSLRLRWVFDSDDSKPGNLAYRGQGNHNLAVGDVDGDGKDEIIYGACAIDDDGTGLYSTGLGHGDAMHLCDIDPQRPGLEVWGIHENPSHPFAANLRDAATGQVIWALAAADVGRGLCMDLDPRYLGYECWASGISGLFDCKGALISKTKPRSCNFGVWWDGDLLRELLDQTYIAKWNWLDGTETTVLQAEGCRSNNGTKATPCLCADIIGDWREEVIWPTTDNRYLRVYTTTIPTVYRLPTLMHDRQYRLSVAWQNVGYNQPTQPGFYLGYGMDLGRFNQGPVRSLDR